MSNRNNRLWPLMLLLMSGCYNADVLLKKHSKLIEVTHLEEIDLGAFQVTLPHVLGSATDSIVEFHAFGHVDSADRSAVKHVLDTRGPELRSRMLVSVRAMNDAAFDEPKLTTLRHTISDAINGALEEKLVKKVGFYHFAFNTM
jgi:hypothetical protein